ncbi:hypothetical protein RSOLAG1IB_06534 [Rhizoctonia solani AG-1 IB]|uniref:DUF6533 domain-containing protein n=2 Tax=Thanatephorus cucumeris (strain AG1-IB / isolate 7/3/14) TaxID=1108050 RepID=A0A0B7F9V5_THACB|nr:hypothetical protein RSOLAG1IB_06534 [Rhizoctonia solani AG-1 IB]
MSSITGMTPEELAHTITEAQHINAAKYYLIASITMMAYDMVLTFHLEYEYIWKRKKTLVSYLFLVNRYLNPCYYIITTTAYFDPSWTFAFEGAATCATYAITNLMMTLRVHALWQNRWVLGYLLSLCVIQVAMWGYVLNYSEPVSYPNIDVIFHGCILTGKPSFGNQWQMWLFAYVVFDSSVFALVLAKTLRYSRETHSPLVKTLRNDGTAYFVVIFTVNVVWLVMTFHATETLKNINEHFSHLVSVVLISRLTIHLRSEGDRHSKEIWRPGPPVPSARGRNHSNSLSGPPLDPTASVNTYAGQRWSRSEKGKNKSLDGVGSPPESVSTTFGPSPGSTVADLNKDLEKAGESSRIWRRGSLMRRDSIAFEGERQRERPPSWMNRMRTVSRRESAAPVPSSTEMEPYVRSFPQTIASWDSTREAGPSPIEAAALSIRRSEDDVFAFSMPERPPMARLATEYI